jgi:orotate phosphoribosyltransferase
MTIQNLQLQILTLAKDKGALQFGNFTLSSGSTSTYYFDGRLLTLDPEGAYLVSKALLPQVREWNGQAIGGPTLGADPIVAAVVLSSFLEGNPVNGFLVRKEQKEHGTGRLIEGSLFTAASSPYRVVIVDDTCSTGGSLIMAIQAVEQEGCEVVGVAVILDRHQGGSEWLLQHGYQFLALLEADPNGGITPTKLA